MTMATKLMNEDSVERIRLGFYPYTYVRSIAMRSLLLKKEDYHKLMKMSLNEMTKFMQDSAYKKEINELASKHSGIALLELALNKNMAASFDKLRKICPDELKLLIDEYTKRNDIEDIKTILRGKFTKESSEKIKSLIIGAGTLSLEHLYKLSEMEVPEILKNLKVVEYSALKEAYKRYTESKTLSPIENALDRNYYNHMLNFIDTIPEEGKAFRRFLRKEIEIINIMNIIRLKRENLDKDAIERYIFYYDSPEKNKKIRPLLNIDNVRDILKKLEKEEYGKEVKEGAESFERTGSFIELETSLYRYLLRKSVSISRQNPLSIDVILGYMFSKEMDMRNLRLILKGKELSLDENFIEKQLVI